MLAVHHHGANPIGKQRSPVVRYDDVDEIIDVMRLQFDSGAIGQQFLHALTFRLRLCLELNEQILSSRRDQDNIWPHGAAVRRRNTLVGSNEANVLQDLTDMQGSGERRAHAGR